MKNLSSNSRAIKTDSMHDRRLTIQKTWTDEERVDRLHKAIKIQERLAALLSLGQEKEVLGRRVMELAS